LMNAEVSNEKNGKSRPSEMVTDGRSERSRD
jgi:hypothetical protein